MSLRYKLLVSFLMVGLVPMLLVGVFTTYQASNLAEDITTDKLVAINQGKQAQIEDYFSIIRGQMLTFSNSHMVRQALTDFNMAVDAITMNTSIVNDYNAAKLRARYEYQLENTPGATQQDMQSWQKLDATAKRMQHLYISDNPHEIGAKENLDTASDGSLYSSLHGKYHPVVRQYLRTFGYYDIFLIEPANGRIIYSVFKEVDFGTSLKTGPYAQTNFGQVARAALNATDQNFIAIKDFEPYAPSYAAPASFIASPVFKDNKLLGAVVFQMPVDAINAIMAGTKDVQTDAPKSLQSYLMNASGQMNSNSPLTEENTLGLQLTGSVAETARNATAPGMMQGTNYTGATVQARYAPLDIPGLNYFVISEIEVSEMMASITSLQYFIAGFMLVCLLMVMAMAYWAKAAAMRPIGMLTDQLGRMVQQVGQMSDNIRAAVQGVVAASEETSQQSVVVRGNAQNAADNTNSVAAAVEEMDASIEEINRSVEQTDAQVQASLDKADATSDVVTRLGTASNEIADVLKLITDIADQTNLLALNASIEAARAGEAGRGFAVVADEVKKLADNTIKATSSIHDQIGNMQGISTEAATAMEAIRTNIDQVRENASAVVTAVQQQSAATNEISQRINQTVHEVNQVNQNMEGIEAATQDTSVSVNEVMSAIEQLDTSFQQLRTDISTRLQRAGVDFS